MSEWMMNNSPPHLWKLPFPWALPPPPRLSVWFSLYYRVNVKAATQGWPMYSHAHVEQEWRQESVSLLKTCWAGSCGSIWLVPEEAFLTVLLESLRIILSQNSDCDHHNTLCMQAVLTPGRCSPECECECVGPLSGAAARGLPARGSSTCSAEFQGPAEQHRPPSRAVEKMKFPVGNFFVSKE